MNRKPSTIQDYEIMLRHHLEPLFAGRSLGCIDTQFVSDYLVAKQRDGLSSKTVGNQLTFLHGIFRHTMKKGWAYANPVAALDRPHDAETDADIRFPTHEGVEALTGSSLTTSSRSSTTPSTSLRSPAGCGRASFWRSDGATSIG